MLVVRKQPSDTLVAGFERLDQIRREKGIDLAFRQHVLQRIPLRRLREVEAGRRHEFDILVDLAQPLH